MKSTDMKGAPSYLLGADAVAFPAQVKHGNGFRDVQVLVPPDVIVRLGHYLAPVVSIESGHAHFGKLNENGVQARAHAFRHAERPSLPYPCEECHELVREPGKHKGFVTVEAEPYESSMMCVSGKHAWLDEESREKCCNGYRRILVVARVEESTTIGPGAVTYGYVWERIPEGGAT